MPRSAMLLGSMVVGATLLAPPQVNFGLGLSSAEAAAPARKRGAGKASKAGAKQAAAPGKKGARRVKFIERKGILAKARYAALPKFKPKVVLRPAPAAPSVAVAPKPAEPVAAASQVTPQAPEAASLASLPPDRVIATASINPAPIVHPGAERMRSALEFRARGMASELGLATLPLPEAAPAPQMTARSVTFDLEKGERTIVFEDGAAVTAPFDKGKASDLTGVKPAAR